MSLAATLGNDVPGGNVQAEQKFFRAFGTLTFTGSYATGGDALSFASVVPIPKAASPICVWINGVAGFEYSYNKATGKVQVWGQQPTSASAGVIALSELAAGAYPAGVTGDTIAFEAIFPKA